MTGAASAAIGGNGKMKKVTTFLLLAVLAALLWGCVTDADPGRERNGTEIGTENLIEME